MAHKPWLRNLDLGLFFGLVLGRGFKQDGVGPIDPLFGEPAGGAVVFVINQELRFPILGPVSGVVFYDAGSVYSTLRDVRVGDIRLIRADYGTNLRPRPGEPRGVFYLSIGQAF